MSDATTTPQTRPTGQTNPTGLFASFQAHDAEALRDFLVTTLGFAENVVHREGDRIAHAQLDWPEGGGVMFGSHKPGAAWSSEPGTAGVYLVSTDVDAVAERVRQAGAEVVRPLADTDYGSREMTVRDPEGNLWSIGSYAGEPRATSM